MCYIVYHGKPVKVSSANNLKSIRAPPVAHDPYFVGSSDWVLIILKSVSTSDRQKTWNSILWELLCVQLLVFLNQCTFWSAENTGKHNLASSRRTIQKQITLRSSQWGDLCGGLSQISQIGAKSWDFVSVLSETNSNGLGLLLVSCKTVS